MLFVLLQRKLNLFCAISEAFCQKDVLLNQENYEVTSIQWVRLPREQIDQNLEQYLKRTLVLAEGNLEVDLLDWTATTRPARPGDLIQTDDHRTFKVTVDGFEELNENPFMYIAHTEEQPHGELVDVIEPLKDRDWAKDKVVEQMQLGFHLVELCEAPDGSLYRRLRTLK